MKHAFLLLHTCQIFILVPGAWFVPCLPCYPMRIDGGMGMGMGDLYICFGASLLLLKRHYYYTTTHRLRHRHRRTIYNRDIPSEKPPTINKNNYYHYTTTTLPHYTSSSSTLHMGRGGYN
jgi:hypothetical protein